MAGALEARQIEVESDAYEVQAIGDVFEEDHVLVIRRITVRYRLAEISEAQRDQVERVHGFNARFCPVVRSLEGAIEIRTELAFG